MSSGLTFLDFMLLWKIKQNYALNRVNKLTVAPTFTDIEYLKYPLVDLSTNDFIEEFKDIKNKITEDYSLEDFYKELLNVYKDYMEDTIIFKDYENARMSVRIHFIINVIASSFGYKVNQDYIYLMDDEELKKLMDYGIYRPIFIKKFLFDIYTDYFSEHKDSFYYYLVNDVPSFNKPLKSCDNRILDLVNRVIFNYKHSVIIFSGKNYKLICNVAYQLTNYDEKHSMLKLTTKDGDNEFDVIMHFKKLYTQDMDNEEVYICTSYVVLKNGVIEQHLFATIFDDTDYYFYETIKTDIIKFLFLENEYKYNSNGEFVFPSSIFNWNNKILALLHLNIFNNDFERLPQLRYESIDSIVFCE